VAEGHFRRKRNAPLTVEGLTLHGLRILRFLAALPLNGFSFALLK
jgi:hypothetical protein